jgi:hypothetical protein
MKEKWIRTAKQLPSAEYFACLPPLKEMLKPDYVHRGPIDLLVVVENHPPGSRARLELWKRGTVSEVYFRQVVKFWKQIFMPESL